MKLHEKEYLMNRARISSINNPDTMVYALINKSVGQSTITRNEEVVKQHLANGFILYGKYKNGDLYL